jgi:hypothetical protein
MCLLEKEKQNTFSQGGTNDQYRRRKRDAHTHLPLRERVLGNL